MLPRRPKPVRNPQSAFFTNRRERRLREYFVRRFLRDMASAPVIVDDFGHGEPEADVPAHLARLM